MGGGGGGVDVTSIKKKKYIRFSDFCSKYLEESDHLADLERRDLEKVWTGFIWLKIKCSGGLLRTR